MSVTVLRIIARMNVGGPAQQIAGLLHGMDPERYRQLLAVGGVDEDEEDWLTLRSPELRDDPRIVRIPHLGRSINPIRDLRAYWEIRRLIRRVRPALVHTHTAKAGLVGRLAALHEGVPVVHTFHGHVLRGYFGRFQTLAIRTCERALASKTRALLSVGANVRDELLSAGVGKPSQYVVVPPGVVTPTQYPMAEARGAMGLGAADRVVTFVGRVTEVKRLDRFLDMAEHVAQCQPDAVFMIAGGGGAELLEEAMRAGRRARIRLLGWVADVGQVYAASDVIVLSSDNEGMPVSLIEAGLCGRPCVATDVGSVSEVVVHDRTGLVVLRDSVALAQAVIELLRDARRREQFGLAAAAHTRERFAMEHLIAATTSVYDRVLDTTRSASRT